MANRAVRERIAQDLGLWLADGLIPKETHDLLRQRYAVAGFDLAQSIKTIGIAGGLFAFFGLLGLVGALSRSLVFAALLLGAVGCGLMAGGLRLAADKLDRYGTSSKALLMLGVVTVAVGVGVGLSDLGVRDQLVFMTGALLVFPLGYLAYRYSNQFLLVITLIGFFHWVGSWTSMFGRSTYALDVQDPRLMSLVALAAIVVGVYHERNLRHQTGRFFQAYESLGLIYLNLSLLILSIEHNWRGHEDATWALVLFAAAIAQIVAGARLHNSLITGFGVTAFAINLFTRYYEWFWNRMSMGVFFLAGGLGLYVAGFACEVALRQFQKAER